MSDPGFWEDNESRHKRYIEERDDRRSHIGCKHLDYEDGKYPNCDLITIQPEDWIKPPPSGLSGYYWQRNVVPYEGAPVKVQFCKLRGRINDVFSCINPGERCCFEAKEE